MRMASYLTAGLVLAILIGGIAAEAPARVKLLGLFPIGLSLATGGLLGWIARELQIPGTWGNRLWLGVCILAGQGAVTAQAYRLNVEFWNDHFRSMPLNSSLPDFTPEQIAEMPADSREVAEQIVRAKEQRRELRSFSGWLRQRLPLSFEGWPPVAYLIWWVAETTFATIAGVLLGNHYLRQRPPAASAVQNPLIL